MRQLLARALEEGAIGLASGLIYPPSAYGTTDELASQWKLEAAFTPVAPRAVADARHAGWRRAVDRARGWARV